MTYERRNTLQVCNEVEGPLGNSVMLMQLTVTTKVSFTVRGIWPNTLSVMTFSDSTHEGKMYFAAQVMDAWLCGQKKAIGMGLR